MAIRSAGAGGSHADRFWACALACGALANPAPAYEYRSARRGRSPARPGERTVPVRTDPWTRHLQKKLERDHRPRDPYGGYVGRARFGPGLP